MTLSAGLTEALGPLTLSARLREGVGRLTLSVGLKEGEGVHHMMRSSGKLASVGRAQPRVVFLRGMQGGCNVPLCPIKRGGQLPAAPLPTYGTGKGGGRRPIPLWWPGSRSRRATLPAPETPGRVRDVQPRGRLLGGQRREVPSRWSTPRGCVLREPPWDRPNSLWAAGTKENAYCQLSVATGQPLAGWRGLKTPPQQPALLYWGVAKSKARHHRARAVATT